MKSLFEKSSFEEIEGRINKLTTETQPLWGKMSVDQMLAHCVETMAVVLEKKKLPRSFLGYILGPLFKAKYYDDSPSSKNSPTASEFIITDQRDFETEKTSLLAMIRNFHQGGEEKCTKEPHSFFGKLTPEQWGKGVYKHLDHHLRQFGV